MYVDNTGTLRDEAYRAVRTLEAVPFPDAASFRELDDFVVAAGEWASAVAESLNGAQLPLPVSRVFARPRWRCEVGALEDTTDEASETGEGSNTPVRSPRSRLLSPRPVVSSLCFFSPSLYCCCLDGIVPSSR